MLIWFDTAAEMKKHGSAQPQLVVAQSYAGPFALVHDAATGTRQDVELVNSRIYDVSAGADHYAALVLCRLDAGVPKWTIYCGDQQVSGVQTGDGKTLAAKTRKDGIVSNSVSNTLEASDWVRKIPSQAACGFFKMLQRGQSQTPPVVKICSHTQAVLANIPLDDFEEMATEIKDWMSGATMTTAVPVGAMSPEEAAFHDAAFIQHVLLAGERGAGKTYLARSAADRHDAVYLEMQMHPSMEAWEFRAHDRAWNGKVYTVLGKLAEAVYWIQQGKKVVLAMDEFLNMNPMYTTAINTPLTLTENDTYLIETGRIIDMGDGIGRLETVEVPSDMFWVVATTNVGARYNLDKMTPSARARFQIILMNTNADRTKSILEKNLAKYDMPTQFADMFKKFIESANQAVLENTLDEEATTRLACNVIRAVHKKSVRDMKKYTTLKQWLPVVKAQVNAEIAQVVNFELGPLDVDQEERYKALVDASFKA